MGNVLRRNNICGNSNRDVNDKTTPSETGSNHDEKVNGDNSVQLTKSKFEPVKNIILSNEGNLFKDNDLKNSEQGDVTWRKLNSNEVEDNLMPEEDEIDLYQSDEFIISLLPHQHTLFCERKQRVCTAVGKLQELEYVAVTTRSGEPLSQVSFCWIRFKSSLPDATFEIISDSENCESYQLQREDVGHWISICYNCGDDSVQNNSIPATVSEQPEIVTPSEDKAKTVSAGGKEECVTPLVEGETVMEADGSVITAPIATVDGNGDAANSIDVPETTNSYAPAEDRGTVITPSEEQKVDVANESTTSIEPAATLSAQHEEIRVGDNTISSVTIDAVSVTTENLPTLTVSATETVSSLEGSTVATTPPPSETVEWNLPTAETESGVVLGQRVLLRKLGPVLAGPPRLLDMSVEVETISLPTELVTAGADGSALQVAVARSEYIGGVEGQSEYWWFRISSDGRREQVTEPIAVSNPALIGENLAWSDFDSNDPRFYRITQADFGCTLKAKCRPVRNDNFKGEIFTSKSSAVLRDKRHSS